MVMFQEADCVFPVQKLHHTQNQYCWNLPHEILSSCNNQLYWFTIETDEGWSCLLLERETTFPLSSHNWPSVLDSFTTQMASNAEHPLIGQPYHVIINCIDSLWGLRKSDHVCCWRGKYPSLCALLIPWDWHSASPHRGSVMQNILSWVNLIM